MVFHHWKSGASEKIRGKESGFKVKKRSGERSVGVKRPA